MTEYGPSVPILRIFDEAKAREFYIEFLGFKVEWEHRFTDSAPLYMQVSLGNCLLHLSEHHGDSTPGMRLRIEAADLDGYAKRLADKEYAFAQPGEPQRMPWGDREMTIVDPFGNRLTFWIGD